MTTMVVTQQVTVPVIVTATRTPTYTPSATFTPSTLRIGVTSAAVPVKNSSSAMYRNSRGIVTSRTSYPISLAIWMIDIRVMPGRSDDASQGV